MGDPNALTNVDWVNISNWLTTYWLAFPLVIITAFTLMTALAFIPSAVATGHLPEGFNKLRWPMVIFAVAVWIVAWILWISVMLMTPDTLGNIYDRFLV